MKHTLPLIKSIRNTFKILSLLTLFVVTGNAFGQTYTQVTTTGQLTSGDYLIVGDGASDGLMLNTTSSGPIINFSSISNPGSTISSGFTSGNIFEVTVTGTQITIYNSSVGYVSWGNTGTGYSKSCRIF